MPVFKKVCQASKAGAFSTVQTVWQLAMMADEATRHGICESESARCTMSIS